MSLEAIDNGRVHATVVSTLNAIWAGWMAGLSGFELGVWSPTRNECNSVTSVVTRNIWHHIKSRNPA